jgi:hypothetical protein
MQGKIMIKIANRFFENVAQFSTYLGRTGTNKNLIHEEIKRRLNVGNALLPFSPVGSHLLPNNVKLEYTRL